MSTIGSLPEPCRRCVRWEVPRSVRDPDRETDVVGVFDGEFEKEVWLSGVMLTWGTAGQIVLVDDEPAGFALYAPPTAVPAATAFPTSPVSPDAVLLTTAHILPQYAGQGLARFLLTGVVTDLTRRGVRAIELFGRRGDVDDPVRADQDAELQAELEAELAVDDPDAVRIPRCLVPASFALAVGFQEVAPHHRYPRLRYELAQGSGWKADVEAALERLVVSLSVPARPVDEPARQLVGQTAHHQDRQRD
jgi:GNAT superfamily N-acetyltransferase